MERQQIFCLFGVQEETVRERLADVLTHPSLTAILTVDNTECKLQLTTTDEQILAWANEAVVRRLGAYIYSTEDASLEKRAISLLQARGKTVAVAESCTGGLLASRLTDVSGCSQVFGTGVVSYSWECKRQWLGVSLNTLEIHGAVSKQTAQEMANGIRQRAGADIGIGVTGEAGPTAAENKPIGTVFVALADKKRCWVKELHLDGDEMDRAAVRRAATSYALDMLRRYLEAYPTVMAGGERHSDYSDRQQTALDTRGQRFIKAVLPWRGSRRLRVIKTTALLAALLVLVSGVLLVSKHIVAPENNRELQDDLADLYWSDTTDLTVENTSPDKYPAGMKSQFQSLYDLNNDIAGWVRIPDTTVNYPVTFYADGYYNNHSFNDQYSVYGQPYFDEMNTRESVQTDKVMAIHGNNTRDEQMFSALLAYRRIAYLREHALIEMNTLYTDARWEVFAVAVVDEHERATTFDYLRKDFESDTAYESYLHELQRRSLYGSDIKPSATDTVLLLVTKAEKEYGFSGARLVVAARQVDVSAARAEYTHNTAIRWPAVYARRMTRTTTRTTTTAAPTTAQLTSAATTTTLTATTTSPPSTIPAVTATSSVTTTSTTKPMMTTVTTADTSTKTTVTTMTQLNTSTSATSSAPLMMSTATQVTSTSATRAADDAAEDMDRESADDDNLGY